MLDASAIIAYLRGEIGVHVVGELLFGADEECMVHAINLCEVYYNAIRLSDESSAAAILEDLKGTDMIVREDLDEAFWLAVGGYKAVMKSVSLADCFAIALANRVRGRVVTADHPDFDPIKEQRICRVEFIR